MQQSEDSAIRKFLIGAATIAALAAVPTAASAHAATATGVAVGAGTGFVIAGPPGAIVGGIIGGSFGMAAEPPVVVEERVVVAPRAYVDEPVRVCWRDAWGRTICEYR